MKSKNFVKKLIILFAVFSLVVAFVGCSEPEPESTYEFDGLKEIRLSVNDSDYDFKNGVTAYKDLEETTFDVDKSGITFGVAGEYSVKYRIEKYEETVKVFVYGLPVFSETGAKITYADAQNASALKKAVKATDTFGTDLEVRVEQGITSGANGYIEYGAHEVKFSATDAVGNKAEYTCEIEVSDADKPDLKDINIDLADIGKATVYEGTRILKIMEEGAVLTAEDYSFINGYLVFTESFVLSKETGSYTLTIVTAEGYADVTLTITDKEDAKYTINVSDMSYENTLSITKAVREGHQKNISFSYMLETAEGVGVPLTEDENSIYFEPGKDTKFILKVTASRGELPAGEREYPFTVQDDVYMWTVNRNNDKTAVNFVLLDEAYEYGYSTEQNFNGLGSLKIRVISGGCAQILLYNVKNIPVNSTLSFYVYNPNGIALQSYISTNSGYWINQGLEVLSSIADISAETGWQKVSITMKPQFDGSLGSMSTFDENASQAELRIFNPDAWKWDGDEKFTLYMTNVSIETVHGAEGVSYDESAHRSEGVINVPTTFATALSTDNRHSFVYAVKDGETTLKESAEPFSYTFTEEKEYTYVISVYWRDTLVDVRTYTIKIGGALALSTSAYYQFDAEGKITLPAASCAIEGVALKYVVTNPSGGATELGEGLIYDTGKVHGTYEYKVEATKDGKLIDTVKKNFLVHDSRVLLGCGLGAENVDNGKLSFGNPVFSYTTDIAAPGELGAMKLDNSANPEKGNFNIRLESTGITGDMMIVFWIKNTSSVNLGLQMYSATTWLFGNFWYNGTKYEQNATGLMDYVIAPSDEWVKIEVFTRRPDGAKVSGNDIRLQFASQVDGVDYAWDDTDPVIYMSNIYYVALD